MDFYSFIGLHDNCVHIVYLSFNSKSWQVLTTIETLEQSDSDKGPRLMPTSEKAISILAKILIINFSGQNPYSDMNKSLLKVLHIWNLEDKFGDKWLS